MASSSRQTQRIVQKGPSVQAVTVIASELLKMTPEDAEVKVLNESESNPAIEKTEQDHDVALDKQYVRNITYGVSGKVQEIFEKKAAYSETLIEHMQEQISSSPLDERQRMIADYIVGSLDRNGYFRDDPYALADDISFKESLLVEEHEVIEVLHHIQQMEPVGIGAQDLKECLMLQLSHRNSPYTATARTIVDKCFNDFMGNRRDRIARTLSLSVDEVNEVYAKEIRKLDPKPAGAYDTSDTDYMLQVTPTFVVSVDVDQITYEIPNRIPELHVSQAYKEALEHYDHKENLSESEKEEKKSIKDNVDSADVFVSALKMRQETLKQTIEAIVHMQRDFFLNNGDPAHLKPMKLKDLERMTGRNASVLSRATSGKYVSTPWGLMPLRELFSERGKHIDDSGQEGEVSTRIIKEKLRQIIANEDKSHPLSDDRLEKMLNEEGFQIKRRTVAKYRVQLGLPTASLRREYNEPTKQ